MTLSRKIADAVEAALASATPPPVIEAEDGPRRVALRPSALGPVGLAFDGLDYAESGRADRSAGELRAWGDRLAARLTYLMEPLVLLEVDAEAGEAELRSQSPTARDDRRAYYEVRLRREGSLHLRRVGFDTADGRRSAIPCHMTLEVLGRLVDDLVACSA